jgi:hypothetical protein
MFLAKLSASIIMTSSKLVTALRGLTWERLVKSVREATDCLMIGFGAAIGV